MRFDENMSALRRVALHLLKLDASELLRRACIICLEASHKLSSHKQKLTHLADSLTFMSADI